MELKELTELLILDFDGTLVDTRDDIVDGVNEALEDLGLPRRPASEIACCIGRGVEYLAAGCLPPGGTDLLQPMLERFRIRYEQCFDRTSRPYPGVVEGLNTLRQRGLQLAVASNKPSRYLLKLMEIYRLRPLFLSVIGGDEMERKKPDPWCIRRIGVQSGIQPERTLMAGDMVYDMETGVNAGTDTCGVLYGYGSEQELHDAGARHLVHSFTDLVALIRGTEKHETSLPVPEE
jgi:phosphoglycolate phosphatase